METDAVIEQNAIYEQALATRSAIGSLYATKLQAASRAAMLPNWGLFLLMSGQAAAPEPLTIQHVLDKIPYMNGELIRDNLEQTAVSGFLATSSDGYRLTESGKQTVAQLLNVVSATLTRDVEMADDDLTAVAALLNQLSNACAQSPQPAAKPALSHARFYTPAPTKPLLEQIGRAISEIAAFRDDAHAAAWKKHQIQGYVWEAFSHVWGKNVWGDPVNTVDNVAAKLSFRGYDKAAYTAALDHLVACGWLHVQNSVYRLTASGSAVRQAAEQQTDQLFFAPWQALSLPEQQLLHEKLTALQHVLRASNVQQKETEWLEATD